MIRTLLHQLTPHSAIGAVLRASCATFLLSAALSAQVDQYRLFQQQQMQSQSASGSLPGNSLEDCGLSDCSSSGSISEPIRPMPTVAGRSASGSLPPAVLPSERAKAPESEYRVTEAPTEFQRFVQASTGQMLSIYGAWLFEHVPSTFAPLDQVPVTPDYTLGPGDQIDVRVWGQINFSQPLTIDRSGDVFLPQVGRISLSGLRFNQVHDAMRSAIGRVYKNFDINVNMGRLRSIEIFIVGQARRPGTYTVSSLSTLVNALFASGGPSSRGSMRRIELKRCDKLITTFDFYDLLLRGDKSKDVPLQAGDVIFIPTAGQRVAIAGTVETPAIYEIKKNTSLGDVLNDAGGLSSVAAGKRAILERVNQHAALRSEDVQLNADGLTKVLQDGDIVRLLSVVPRFENTITIRGNVTDPVRLPWHEGMRVSDAIPDKEALLTRNYWFERNRLRDANQEQAETLVASLSSADTKILPASQGYRDESRNTAADKSLAATVSNQDTPPIRHFGLRNDLQPAAPDIDWNYASIERVDNQNLSTHLIAFNLGKVVIKHDASADLTLQPGDVITVFSRADIATPHSEQTKYVRLEGEINMAGVYSVEPGETLRELVARAGGLSPNAYLYGAQFTRESTRREQQKRYSEFLDQLDRDINQNASTVAGRSTSTEMAMMTQSSLASQRNLVEHLRQNQATGRIVFDLEPASNRVDNLPNIPLENGDRLFVPNTPSTLNVVGTVYNQSAFLYASDLRLGEYLKEAGGPTRYADKSHMFVIRADGSIISRETRSGLFSANFDSLRMYPGDTLVIPTNVTRTTRLRGFLDWSQVISNFGIGAAAVNVLK